MREASANAAMLWTGGKDSAMALYEAVQAGYQVCSLVTFAPPVPDFLAHPLDIIQRQARALDLPHRVVTVNAPYAQGYEAGLRSLRNELGIDCVITGDIAEVDGHPNWVCERSVAVGLNVYTPLWGRDRNTLLTQFMQRGFKARFSCVHRRWLDDRWVGRELDDSAIAELHTIRQRNGLDLCGEDGEYHTLVTDGPSFAYGIEMPAYTTRQRDTLAYLAIQ